jgi:hypothetical protein
MADLVVCNRRVITRCGRKNKTVSVCTEEGIKGKYAFVVEFEKNEDDVEDRLRTFSGETVPQLILDLKNTWGGHIRRVPPVEDALLHNADLKQQADGHSHFGTSTMHLVEQHVNDLVRDFLRSPYSHRSEHNLHCELYRRLACEKSLARTYTIGTTTQEGRLLHKEWPERFAKDRVGSFDPHVIWPLNRPYCVGPHVSVTRGTYDIALLSPTTIAECVELNRYIDGNLVPTVVVEFGLNEGYDHLRSDTAKVINNKVRYGVLVHFVRPHTTDNFDAAHELCRLVHTNSHIRTAYARVEEDDAGRSHYCYKFTHSQRVEQSDALP